eukprot:1138128-Pelagomonas_calceolata.AAC.7
MEMVANATICLVAMLLGTLVLGESGAFLSLQKSCKHSAEQALTLCPHKLSERKLVRYPLPFVTVPSQEHVGHVASLQPGLESAGLGGRCHMAVEYARAMRDATK